MELRELIIFSILFILIAGAFLIIVLNVAGLIIEKRITSQIKERVYYDNGLWWDGFSLEDFKGNEQLYAATLCSRNRFKDSSRFVNACLEQQGNKYIYHYITEKNGIYYFRDKED